MTRLNAAQREQTRKDLIDMHKAQIAVQNAQMTPANVKTLLQMTDRVINTLAIAAGVFDESLDNGA